MGIIKMGIAAAGAAYVVKKITKSAEEMNAANHQAYPQQGPNNNRGPQQYDNRGPAQQCQCHAEGHQQQQNWQNATPPQYRDLPAGEGRRSSWEEWPVEKRSS